MDMYYISSRIVILLLMSHIVIDARESGTSTGRYTDKLIEHLAGPESEHTFTLLAKKHRLEFLKSIAPKWKVVETPYQEFSLGEQIGFKRQIESLQPDLVHFPIVQQPVLYRGKTVTTMNDLTTVRFRNPTKNQIIFLTKQQVYKWLNKRVAHKANHIITISEYVKQDVADYCRIPLGKITTTLLAADPITEPSQTVESLFAKRFIMYVGRPLPHKNLRRLIDAFVMLQQKHPNLMLALAGKKDAAYALHEHYIQEQGIKNVVFTGFVSDGQLRWMYEHCAAYVFPSLSEGFGLPGLEAMMHGAPVISSNTTCLPEVNGDAALYFNPLDVADIATKISRVIGSDSLRRELVAKGKINVKKFSWDRCAQQTFAVYEHVLKS